MDEAKLMQFIGKAVTKWGAAMGALLIFVGDNYCRKALEMIEYRIARILKHSGREFNWP
jgi:hypothetical protein